MKTFKIIFVSIIIFLGSCCIANAANDKPKKGKQTIKISKTSDVRKFLNKERKLTNLELIFDIRRKTLKC